ncbi:MAG: PAS domain-containing protein [Deltaproteobacteria bacterium]|nr:MAG: PAS domain-containing protein [Deltaproteobacteria bacterium]
MLNKMKTILTYLDTPIIIGDANNKLIYLNPAGEEVFQRKVMELVGKEVRELFSGDSWEGILETITQVRKQNRPSRISVEAGSRNFRASISPIIGDEEGFIGYVINLLDIAEGKVADQLKADALIIVNQIRDPLLDIADTLNELKKKVSSGLKKEASRLIEKGLEDSQKVIRLVDELLGFPDAESKKPEVKQEELDISKIIKNTISDMEPFAKKEGVALEWTIPANLPKMLGDQEKLTYALNSLLGFSLNHTPAKGVITVSGKTGQKKDGRRPLIITVSDTGEGIDQAELPHLFDGNSPKAHSEEDEPSVRLGAVKDIIEAHQGRISVVSEKGIGTTFSIVLPAVN